MYNNIYKNKKVIITGDTGFKGSWLAIWLKELGAEVFGYSLPPKRDNDNYVLCGLAKKIQHKDGDIRDFNSLLDFFSQVEPEIAFHLAAQPLVIDSYMDPMYTFETNILGTVNFLEAVRRTKSIKVAINVTSDKCYKNNEWVWGYRENDPLGGNDPYSASKASCEIITNSYIESFFNYETNNQVIASVRAGNVIGGGDWSDHRLIPDFFRTIINKKPLVIRNPEAYRPWQFILEPLSGYLLLGQKLYEFGKKYSGAWNFGPLPENNYKVIELVEAMKKLCNDCKIDLQYSLSKSFETKILRLDISKAMWYLNWKPVLSFEEMVRFTYEGYIAEFQKKDIYSERVSQIMQYCKLAKLRHLQWSNED